MTVEPYSSKYKDDVRSVCYATTTQYYTDKKELLFLTYCDYYIDEEAHTFVAVENDKAVGYVMASQADCFLKTFKSSYMPRIKAISYKKYLESRGAASVVKKMKRRFDFHLHIDILPEYQRKGLGHKLVDALISHLKETGAKGVFLQVDAKNEKGAKFYAKYGFNVIKRNKYCITYGIAFGAEDRS